ncbi:MAG: hypothetical protein KTR20_10075 [Cellvibrionaceae bacterium]|nr:hypothetical protein [Cellvibrionaceae bacterium]
MNDGTLYLFAVIPMFAFAVTGLATAITYIIGLDKEKLFADKSWIATLTPNFWIKENVIYSCKPEWVLKVLFIRKFLFFSIALNGLLFLASNLRFLFS